MLTGINGDLRMTEKELKSLGKKMAKLRAEKGLSKSKASKQIKINVVTLRRIEDGFMFHASTASKIAKWISKSVRP